MVILLSILCLIGLGVIIYLMGYSQGAKHAFGNQSKSKTGCMHYPMCNCSTICEHI